MPRFVEPITNSVLSPSFWPVVGPVFGRVGQWLWACEAETFAQYRERRAEQRYYRSPEGKKEIAERTAKLKLAKWHPPGNA